MKIKSLFAKPLAAYVSKSIKKSMQTAVADQEAILKNQLKIGRNTEFGNNHFLKDVTSYEDFKEAIPIRNYEQLKNYIELIKEGKHNVLWRGQPIYFAKLPVVLSTSPSLRTLLTTISTPPEMPSYAIWLKPATAYLLMVN